MINYQMDWTWINLSFLNEPEYTYTIALCNSSQHFKESIPQTLFNFLSKMMNMEINTRKRKQKKKKEKGKERKKEKNK